MIKQQQTANMNVFVKITFCPTTSNYPAQKYNFSEIDPLIKWCLIRIPGFTWNEAQLLPVGDLGPLSYGVHF